MKSSENSITQQLSHRVWNCPKVVVLASVRGVPTVLSAARRLDERKLSREILKVAQETGALSGHIGRYPRTAFLARETEARDSDFSLI